MASRCGNVVQPLCFFSAGNWSRNLYEVTISRNRGFRVSSCLRLGIGRSGDLPSQIVEQNTWREQIWPVCLFSRPRSSHSRSLRRVIVRAHRLKYVGLRSIPSAVFLGTSFFVVLGFHPCFHRVVCRKISHELWCLVHSTIFCSAQGRIGRNGVMCMELKVHTEVSGPRLACVWYLRSRCPDGPLCRHPTQREKSEFAAVSKCSRGETSRMSAVSSRFDQPTK